MLEVGSKRPSDDERGVAFGVASRLRRRSAACRSAANGKVGDAATVADVELCEVLGAYAQVQFGNQV